MNKTTHEELTCIICPSSCRLLVHWNPETRVIHSVGNARCKRGVKWVDEELLHPLRILTSSVRITGGKEPLASVKTDRPIARESLLHVMEELKGITRRAPVEIGETILENPAGTTCRIIVTRSVEKVDGEE